MKKTLFFMLASALVASCSSEEDFQPKEPTVKKITVSLVGVEDKYGPWTSFVAYTEHRQALYAIIDGDTVISQNGTLDIPKGQVPSQLTVYAKSIYPSVIFASVTYRKRMSSPSQADELKVKIEGYVNDIQQLDTMRVMSAFSIEDKPKEKDYMFDVKI